MRILFLLTALFITTISLAQDFKPYQIKSGKIEYEKIRYKMHVGFKSENGVETGFREIIPYVSEQVIYYWENFGDIAFEETYQISKFGGEALPGKIKIYEKLWTGEHRYYYNEEDNEVVDDPYYMRIKCRENFQYYQIVGSWLETNYMGVEKMGTAELLGEEAIHYRIDIGEDMFVWKGLVLKTEDYSFNGAGDKRYDIERSKIATTIDTVTEINPAVFDPLWLEREKLYASLDGPEISVLLDSNSEFLTQADNIKGVKVEKNNILLFVTSDLRLGKMQVLSIDSENQLKIKFMLYELDNSTGVNRISFAIEDNSLCNIDNALFEIEKNNGVDFEWIVTKKSNLFPVNNIGIYLLNSPQLGAYGK